MKSTVSHFGLTEKPGCCRMFNTKYLALISGIYTLVSLSRLEARYQYFHLIKYFVSILIKLFLSKRGGSDKNIDFPQTLRYVNTQFRALENFLTECYQENKRCGVLLGAFLNYLLGWEFECIAQMRIRMSLMIWILFNWFQWISE